jgi:sodium-dependent dicarboxylate transporter 2/3/5
VIVALATWAALALLAFLGIEDPVRSSALAIAAGAIVLWLSEIVPPFVPTLLLWGAIPLALGNRGAGFGFADVLDWGTEPVLALFLGGFAFSVAAGRHGIDVMMAERALGLARFRRRALLALAMGTTAFLSMWISNIAAAAMMMAALRPHLHAGKETATFRSALLVTVALGANFGGMGTPIGTGPNALAIAALSPRVQVTFLQWMGFALPLTIAMLGIGYVAILWRYRVQGRFQVIDATRPSITRQGRWVVAIFLVTIGLWLSEPLHQVPAAIVALLSTAVLFGTGLLEPKDLARIDWSTLLLIAGGITLGRLIERSGLFDLAMSSVDWSAAPMTVRITGLVFVSALLSALMSNTATAAILIPFASGIDPSLSTPVLVAIGASFGILFVVSTPPNAIAYAGGLRARDLLWIGLPLMVIGILVAGLTGPVVLRWMGLP